ncbi:DUF1850 domain-containing protein [Streptomyces sp. ACA25]|uniref:DUF1850 domain-containing protein n=1 Tax=Streptomyces sp. ACA25 TaxID=3022596 RepID=UPI0023073FFE|nr:DUF1850 domain-containing protein [Streptomyces sp. ACA25]MDB1088981.1 DUF1850 domain-containing protein [Streptomyces sp. ACA25]
MPRQAVPALTALAAVLAALAWPVWPGLAVGPEDGPGCRLPLATGDSFTLSFTHSVDRLPVQDRYHVENGKIVQDSTRLRQFGAGMGHISGDGVGREDGDWWEITGMARQVGDLTLRVGGPRIGHRLSHPGGELSLSQRWGGQRVAMRPVRQSTAARAVDRLRGTDCGAQL